MPFNYDFEETNAADDLIREYHERNQRKLDDEKWLKANKPAIVSTMSALGRDKKDFGNLRVSIVTPDESKFDNDSIIHYLREHRPDLLKSIIDYKPVVREDQLQHAIEAGDLDFEELRAVAWIEKTGTPRVTVKPV